MKGQQSMEAFVAFSVILMIFGVVILSGIQKEVESDNLNLFLEANTECQKFSGDFYSISLLGEGTVVILNSEYDFAIVNNTMYILNTICALHASVVNGTSEIFNMPKGDFKVTNMGYLVVSDV